MNNFEITTPTTLLFGKDQLARVSEQIKKHTDEKKILIVYGGGSIERSGFLEKIKTELSEFDLHLFGGVEANPEFTTLMKAVAYIRENDIRFILAIGGGSVIDGTKFIAGAVGYAGDPWEVLLRLPEKIFTNAIPFGCILTIPATGSECNSGAVISRSELKEKRAMGGPLFFPKFALLDPTFVATLPKRQLANGIVDAFTHTMEQYLTFPGQNKVQERFAEGILATLIEIGPAVLENPADYDLAAHLMYAANQALNGMLRCGVTTDWATHMIGHELTALHGIDHAQTLAIIAPRLYENQFENKKAMLAQYGKRVWHLTGDDTTIAREAIVKTEAFFQSLGVKTRIADYATACQDTPAIIKARFIERDWLAMGEKQAITPDDVEQIVKNAI